MALQAVFVWPPGVSCCEGQLLPQKNLKIVVDKMVRP